ncbi:helix-turn-helix domain-containing protein [Paraflavitalea soli]|uniref:Helix-turn-helix domain-containing protein n=1 Tax=Paraflavitalea soli TaxID=2315862 RepID=A0A3B7MSR3_9BACT|nr:helix-turn-helix transcriptional regulator [Paraflavitalea soli]AXY73551.1 helix-turn-helix domain-containing protein [Paraflavitalea soli]
MENKISVGQCIVRESKVTSFNEAGPQPLYGISLFKGVGHITVDFTDYPVDGNIVLFTTPWQLAQLHLDEQATVRSLWFHADFYCIEHHKKEVACNGLLFNNIYAQPFIGLSEEAFASIHHLLDQLKEELQHADTWSQAVARSWLQLILAICSKTKAATLPVAEESQALHPIVQFKALLEQHYIKERTPAFYAAQLNLSPNNFSKQCKAWFQKSPSFLIQERVILEAKKLIHLSYKSMKEIAAELHFDDEHYFSRYFKKHTGVAPTFFRETVGISIVAQSSI